MNKAGAAMRRRMGRRVITASATLAAGALLASAAAWASLVRDDVTLEVFNDDQFASCAAAGQSCSKSVTLDPQVGLATADASDTTVLRLTGSGFLGEDTTFLVNWRKTTSSLECHRPNMDGSVMQIATVSVTGGGTLDATVDSAYEGIGTGLAQVCVLDFQAGTSEMPVGQMADVQLVLL